MNDISGERDGEKSQDPSSETGKERLNEVSELSKKGYQLLKENMIDDAMSCFREILAIDPSNNYALVGLGDAARKKARHKEAIRYYQQCLDNHPGNNYALFGLADCYKSLRMFNQAIRVWEQYLKHDDTNVTVLTRVADAYRKVRDFRRSKEIYLKVLEIEPDNPYALIGLGHLHYDFREYEGAMMYWERMLDVHKENVDIRVLTSLGNCHRKLKTFAQGKEFFQRALELEPGNFYALFGMADCYRGMNEQEKSLEYWNRILDKDPDNKVILTRAGDAYRHLGDYEKAEKYYRNALNIEFDVYAIIGLALISKERGNFENAIESLNGLLKNDSKNHRLYVEIAECYVSMGDRAKAIDTLVQFQKLGIRNPYVSNVLERIRQS